MASVVERSFRILFPRGFAWQLPVWGSKLIEGLSISFARLRAFLRTVLDESLPGHADAMLPEWYEALGLSDDPTLPLATRRNRAESAYVATGGQGFDYLQGRLQAELPDTYILESAIEDPGVSGVSGVGRSGIMRSGGGNPVHTFSVNGFVEDTNEWDRMLSILARVFPLHLQPIINVAIRSQLGLARSGIAKCGVMRSGNTG